jgi:hypothetical protein
MKKLDLKFYHNYRKDIIHLVRINIMGRILGICHRHNSGQVDGKCLCILVRLSTVLVPGSVWYHELTPAVHLARNFSLLRLFNSARMYM